VEVDVDEVLALEVEVEVLFVVDVVEVETFARLVVEEAFELAFVVALAFS
jgi:hypothetical protein